MKEYSVMNVLIIMEKTDKLTCRKCDSTLYFFSNNIRNRINLCNSSFYNLYIKRNDKWILYG